MQRSARTPLGAAILRILSMRLLDLISQGQTAVIRTSDGETLPGAERFAESVRACPVRYVLADELVRYATQLAFSNGDRLTSCMDLIRVPTQSIWIEWMVAPVAITPVHATPKTNSRRVLSIYFSMCTKDGASPPSMLETTIYMGKWLRMPQAIGKRCWCQTAELVGIIRFPAIKFRIYASENTSNVLRRPRESRHQSQAMGDSSAWHRRSHHRCDTCRQRCYFPREHHQRDLGGCDGRIELLAIQPIAQTMSKYLAFESDSSLNAS